MSKYRVVAIIICFVVAISFANQARAQKSEGQKDITVGIFKLSPPEEYIVALEKKTNKKRLYKKASFDAIKDPGLTILQSVILDEIEYRYIPVNGKVLFSSDEFELTGLSGRQAVLTKEHMAQEEPVMEEPVSPSGAPPAFEPSLEEAKKEAKKPAAKRLVASLFLKIGSKKLSEKEWEISLPTLLDAAANFGEVLGIVIKKIDDLQDPKKLAVVYLNSSIGKAVLGPDGLHIESLNSNLRKKSGIEENDLIKTVNGRPLSKVSDVAALFSSFTGSPQTITVGIMRKEESLNYTYYLK